MRLVKAERAGAVVRVEHGAYVPASALAGDEWQRASVVLRARAVADAHRLSDSTVISHLTAAALHGLWVPPRIDEVHVTQAFKSSSPRPGLIRHHRALHDADITTVNGLRVTTLRRTVLDSITMLPPDWAMAVADSALRGAVRPHRSRPERGLAQAAALRAEWLAHLRRQGPIRGCRQAREVLVRADPLAESPGESRVRCLAVAAGLPAPILQMPVETPRGTYFADFGWRIRSPAGVVLACVEFDGQGKYEASGAREAERIREAAIRAQGHRVVRFTGESLHPDRSHLVLPRILDVVPELVPSLTPVLHLNPQPRRPRTTSRRNRR